MTKEKFNLSEKTIKCVCGGDDDNRRILYPEKDVKEFIKRLKEKIKHYRTATFNMKLLKELDREIDKLAGDKLK